MTTSRSLVAQSISDAWIQAAHLSVEAPKGELSPFICTIEGFGKSNTYDDYTVRKTVNAYLRSHGLPSIETTASTIFPESLWDRSKPRDELYQRYFHILPRIAKSGGANRYGIYFQRFTAFEWTRRNGKTPHECVNQLEAIISNILCGQKRRSAFQIAVYDPLSDLSCTPLRGFPCLQQVSFAPEGDNGWSVSGYYARQLIIERAYGNYLGLARLGEFVAHALGRKLTKVICMSNIIGLAGNKGGTKSDVQKLLSDISQLPSGEGL